MVAVALQPQPVSAVREESVMDTRTPSPVQRIPSSDSSDDYKPDLGAEVTMLSTKLMNAINYQTNLDDSLQQTRHELEQSQQQVTRLREEKKELDDMLASGMLVRRTTVEKTIAQLRSDWAVEHAAREAAEKAKKQTEGELENLTSALFEEANTMVAAARKDTEAVEKRNSQLRGQLNDTELLLASQQEQLQDLKATMEKMEQQAEHDSAAAKEGSGPSTPIHSATTTFDALQLSPNSAGVADLTPDHPLHFSQVLSPVLRHDINAYNEFHELLQLARRGSPHSRTSSNSTSNLASSSQTNLASAASSSPNLPGAFSFSANTSPQAANFSQTTPPLKESKFYKRTLIEDLEPTLRLDLAPGLSFLSRRTVLSSLLQGSLVVEPFVPQTKFYGPIYACALCGEHRKDEPYVRKHRFRTSEEDSAQRYPLCDYCLGRIRAAGDFVGFLRMVRDGHWRAESEDELKGAWEESARLRERMFWARLGGGVVPVVPTLRRDVPDTPSTTAAIKSARQSLESIPERPTASNIATAENALPERDANLGGRQTQAVEDLRDTTGVVRERPISTSVARAIMGVSSGVIATATPEVAPPRPATPRDPSTRPTAGPAEEQRPPANIDGASASDSPEDAEEATPPFQDAPSDPASSRPWPNSSGNVDLPTNTAFNATADSTPRPAAHPAALTATASPPPTHDGPTPPPTAQESRRSAVLARVRAMEAKAPARAAAASAASAEKKPPGAFD